MKTKHTPGPWAAHVNEITETYEVQAPKAPMGHSHICNTDSLNVSHDTKRANASLIAAAPEMLEALEYLVNEVRMDISPARNVWILKLIAKAKGE